MHEASLHESNSFVTLTYADEHLPENGSLQPRDFVLFMKRLREYIAPQRVRFFQCGEYGSKTRRPHYHALLFGYQFPDLVPWAKRGENQTWLSPTLSKLWKLGNTEVGSVTMQSAAYVARYVVDKFTGRDAELYYKCLDVDTGELIPIEPEYGTMSRRPGIGAEWFARFGGEVYPADSVIAGGAEVAPPKYYDKLYSRCDPVGAAALGVKRKRQRVARAEDNTDERLEVKEIVAVAKSNLMRRSEL